MKLNKLNISILIFSFVILVLIDILVKPTHFDIKLIFITLIVFIIYSSIIYNMHNDCKQVNCNIKYN